MASSFCEICDVFEGGGVCREAPDGGGVNGTVHLTTAPLPLIPPSLGDQPPPPPPAFTPPRKTLNFCREKPQAMSFQFAKRHFVPSLNAMSLWHMF